MFLFIKVYDLNIYEYVFQSLSSIELIKNSSHKVLPVFMNITETIDLKIFEQATILKSSMNKDNYIPLKCNSRLYISVLTIIAVL